ncbi:Glyoxalase family protein [Rhodovastum atsumiense]|uniref:VOC family protein n=1 Tax=Rhodovastum atsumiense TaxID=504468 RepID=A0A5M6IW70_9PROT|nr:VOC family protein [Rhodovastum atsumiense]KAA5612574.1 VOC family protein [Rhodovastum atsumiense]CAH2601336.1 Glyoxalase family protein [Rhodovastum atsumiense]
MRPGIFVWNELLTPDVEAAKQFYATLAGWSFRGTPCAEGTYWVAELEGKPVAGIMTMPRDLPPHVPPHWFQYLQVDDVDASLEQVTQSGGTILRPPFDVPDVGRIGFITDSTGAALGLMAPLARP